jgi:hypothetical protein
MPCRYHISADHQLLYYFCYGHCTSAELLNTAIESRRDPLCRANMLILIDLLSVSELDFDMPELVKDTIAENLNRQARGDVLEYTAIVTDSPYSEMMETAIRMLEGDLPINLKFSLSLKNAIDWLGLQEFEGEILNIPASLKK